MNKMKWWHWIGPFHCSRSSITEVVQIYWFWANMLYLVLGQHIILGAGYIQAHWQIGQGFIGPGPICYTQSGLDIFGPTGKLARMDLLVLGQHTILGAGYFPAPGWLFYLSMGPYIYCGYGYTSANMENAEHDYILGGLGWCVKKRVTYILIGML